MEEDEKVEKVKENQQRKVNVNSLKNVNVNIENIFY